MSTTDDKKPGGPPPDLDQLARDYMDLWQKHLTGIAADEAAVDLMARTATLMNAGMAAPDLAKANPFHPGSLNTGPLNPEMAAGMMDPAKNPFLAAFQTAAAKASDDDTAKPDAPAHARSAPPAGAAPPATADGDSDHDVAVLASRIAALESRIAELERRSRPKRKRAAKKTAKS